jgi:hypothetical protein
MDYDKGLYMDHQRRKVGHHTLKLVLHGKNQAVPPDRLVRLLSYITTLDAQARFRDLADDRFMLLDCVKNPSAGDFYYLTFLSAKTQYRPALRNRTTGGQRDNPKELVEGEECKTHVVLHLNRGDDRELLPECYLLTEDYKIGVGIRDIAKYLNSHLQEYQKQNNQRPRHKVDVSVVLPDGFLDQIRSAERITKVIVSAERAVLGSDHLNYSNRVQRVDKNVEILIRPVRGESLKEVVEDFAAHVTQSDKGFDASSIRVEYEDFEKNKAVAKADIEGRDLKLVDSLGKVDYIEVSRSAATGETVSSDCFRQMKVLL